MYQSDEAANVRIVLAKARQEKVDAVVRFSKNITPDNLDEIGDMTLQETQYGIVQAGALIKALKVVGLNDWANTIDAILDIKLVPVEGENATTRLSIASIFYTYAWKMRQILTKVEKEETGEQKTQAEALKLQAELSNVELKKENERLRDQLETVKESAREIEYQVDGLEQTCSDLRDSLCDLLEDI